MNNKLREHVTSTAFNLTLSKNQVFSMVVMAEQSRTNQYHYKEGSSRFVCGAKACIERGLLTHSEDGWAITRAGRNVISLLKESGVYQEVVKALTVTELPFSVRMVA